MSSLLSVSKARAPKALLHSTSMTYATQCSGLRGLLTSVHMGTATGAVKLAMPHSRHAVNLGRMTLTWPLKASLPPST